MPTAAQLADAISSNQPSNQPSDTYAGEVRVVGPICDRIVLQANITTSDVVKEAVANTVPPDHLLRIIATSAAQAISTKAEFGYSGLKKRIAGFDAGQKAIGPNRASFVFGVSRPTKNSPHRRSFRMEFNPTKVTRAGLLEIECDWEAALCNSVPLDLFLSKAKVTALHVAIDVVGRSLVDLLPRPRGKKGSMDPKARAAGKWSGHYSALRCAETLSQFSGGKKPRVLFTAYNKRQEQLDHGLTPINGAAPHTRLERKLGNQKRYLRDLYEMANPFASIGVIDLTDACSGLDPIFRLFVDSAGTRGLEGALTFVPEAQQKAWRDQYVELPDAPFWQLDTLWGNWRGGLEQHGLDSWIGRAQASAKMSS